MTQPPIRGDQTNNWQGEWNAENTPYYVNDMVRDGEWTMIANATTSEPAGPLPNGDPTFALADTPLWVSGTENAVVEVDHTYTFSESGWIQEVRIWVDEVSSTTRYRVFVVDETNPAAPITRIIETPPLTAGTWNTIALGSAVISVGAVIRVGMWAIDQSTTTAFTGGWTYDGPSNFPPTEYDGSPNVAGWNRSNNNKTLRVNKIDLAGADRSVSLNSIVPGSTVRFFETGLTTSSFEYRIDSRGIDLGTYVEYVVTLIDIGVTGEPGIGEICTGDFVVLVPSSTNYVRLTDEWAVASPTNLPSWASSITTSLKFDGVPVGVPGSPTLGSPPVGTDDAYGIDIRFQPAYLSPDWDIVSTSANGAGITSVSSLGELDDVFLANLSNGEMLQYNGGLWSNVPESTVGAGITLNNLSDVNTGFPGSGEDGYKVVWDNGTSRYVLVYYSPLAINAQAGTSYTLVLTDAGKYVRMTNAAANTVIVPANAEVAFEIGTEIIIRQAGAGQTTLASPGSPAVTLNSGGTGSPASLSIASQHNAVSIIKVGTDEWDLSGALG